MAEADEAERMLAAKREARAQARRQRVTNASEANASRLKARAASCPTDNVEQCGGDGDVGASTRLQTQYEAALNTIAQLESGKSATLCSLNRAQDRAESAEEDLAEERESVRRYKRIVQEQATVIAELRENINNAATTDPATVGELEISSGASERDDRCKSLTAEVERLKTLLVESGKASSVNKDGLEGGDTGCDGGDGSDDDSPSVERLLAQIARYKEAKDKAEEEEDNAKRELRAALRDVRRLSRKIEEKDGELETLQQAYTRMKSGVLRSRRSSSQTSIEVNAGEAR